MLAPSAEGTRTYDLCINVAGRRLYWRNRNHGVTLGNDCIAWTMDGNAVETAYGTSSRSIWIPPARRSLPTSAPSRLLTAAGS